LNEDKAKNFGILIKIILTRLLENTALENIDSGLGDNVVALQAQETLNIYFHKNQICKENRMTKFLKEIIMNGYADGRM